MKFSILVQSLVNGVGLLILYSFLGAEFMVVIVMNDPPLFSLPSFPPLCSPLSLTLVGPLPVPICFPLLLLHPRTFYMTPSMSHSYS